MKNSEPVSVREASIVQASSGRSTARNSLIGWLLEALYDSRSREARRVIHRYRHLLAEDVRARHEHVTSTTTAQTRECNANADRDKMPRRAIHRALEDA